MTDTQGVEWYSLCNYPYWSEYPADFEEPKTKDRKSMRGYVYSFLCDRRHEQTIWGLIETDKNRIRDAHNDINWYTVFDKEYYWAPAYLDSVNMSRGLGWINLGDGDVRILQTTQRFIWEDEYDFSKTDTIAYDIPTDFVCSSLGMHSKLIPSHYYIGNQLVCFNPSIRMESNHSLLIRKDVLQEWLDRNNLSIIWMMTIEKYVNSGPMSDTRLWADYHGAYRLANGEVKGVLTKDRNRD